MSKRLNRLSNLFLLCLGSVCQVEIIRSSFSCTAEASLSGQFWTFVKNDRKDFSIRYYKNIK